MIKVMFGPGYEQSYQDLVQNNPELRDLVDKLVTIFVKNPNDTRLDNHTLTKKLSGRFAFSITDDIRIKYEWTNKTTVRFLKIGPHSKVYPQPKLPKKQSSKG